MNGFMVNLKNQPGELARVAEAIAHRGINITGFTGAACGDTGTVAIVTNDEAGTRRALADAGFTVREIELVSTSIEDKPGTLAATARRLADAGVNVEAAMPTGMSGGKVTLAFATNDPAKARTALGTSVGAGTGA